MQNKSSFLLFLFVPFFTFCQNQTSDSSAAAAVHDAEIMAYMDAHVANEKESISKGTPGNGSLINGKLLPYYGKNYTYFDKQSYLAGRAFLNGHLLDGVLATYDTLFALYPYRKFAIMECANEHGGKLYPHRTHQNGLSIDFMMPLLKNGAPYYGADTLGTSHYLMQFDDDGKYLKDPSISIDFNMAAHQIILFHAMAKEYGMGVEKVIIKIELKDELFASEFGKQLKASNIYVVKALTSLVNSLHDDHFHLDFEFL
jgi:penicillin-insensitive murein endopeptidase